MTTPMAMRMQAPDKIVLATKLLTDAQSGRFQKDIYWLYYGKRIVELGEMEPIEYLRTHFRQVKSTWAVAIRLRVEEDAENPESPKNVQIWAPYGFKQGQKRQKLDHIVMEVLAEILNTQDESELSDRVAKALHVSSEMYLRIKMGWVRFGLKETRYSPAGRLWDSHGRLVPKQTALALAPALYDYAAKVPRWMWEAKRRKWIESAAGKKQSKISTK